MRISVVIYDKKCKHFDIVIGRVISKLSLSTLMWHASSHACRPHKSSQWYYWCFICWKFFCSGFSIPWCSLWIQCRFSLLLAARRNVCALTTEIPYWWRKSWGSHGVLYVNLFDFMFLLVDYGKVLCSTANELQQNPDAFLKLGIFTGNIDCFVVNLSRSRPRLHLTFVAFVFFLSLVNSR